MAELRTFSNSIQNTSFVVELNSNTYVNVLAIPAMSRLVSFEKDFGDTSLNDLKAFFNFDVAQKAVKIFLQQSLNQEQPIKANDTQQKQSFYDDLDEDFVMKTPAKEVSNFIYHYEEEVSQLSKDISFLFIQNEHGVFVKAKLNRPLSDSLFDIEGITISLNYQTAEHTYYQDVRIQICHPAEFLGIALDFGSEASQMVVTRYSQKGYMLKNPSNEDLFQKVKDYHVSKGWIENSNLPYYQEEKDTPFYKSIFFVQSDLGDKYENFGKENYILEQSKKLKMLIDRASSKKLSEENYKQIPNLKITHKQDNILSSIKFSYFDAIEQYPIDVKLNEVSSKIIHTILRTMIESFLKKEFIQYRDKNRCIRLTLLVPNIYDSDYVKITQQNINQIVLDIASQDAYRNRLKAWEIVTISESDAAFIGYMSKQNAKVLPNQDYVIIDAGKGTTDFSVIKTGQHHIFNVKPQYRNGFAGAGNLITNAIFETIIHLIRELNHRKNGINQFIKQKILQSLEDDLAIRNDFFQELERLKFSFSTDSSVKQYWLQARSGSIRFDKLLEPDVTLFTILDIIKSIDRISDFYGYVQNVCEIISEKVILQLEMVQQSAPHIKLCGAVLTGRGFLFKPLKVTMQQRLQSRLNIQAADIIVLEGNELKDVCIKGVFNKHILINSEIVGYPIQRIKSESAPHEVKLPKLSNDSMKAWWQKLFGSMDDYTQYKHEFLKNNQLNYTRLQHSQIIIGSNTYAIQEHDFYDDNQENIDVSIDYTSDGYKARKLKNGKLLQSVNLEPIYYPDNPELQLIIPSLFPNYINEKYLPSMQVEIETDVNSQFQQNTYTTIEKPDPTLLFTEINLPKRDDLLF